MQNKSYLYFEHFDLISPDGVITKIKTLPNGLKEAEVYIENISAAFVGFKIEENQVLFNLKSTLAQLGLHSIKKECVFDIKHRKAFVKILLIPYGQIAKEMLKLIDVGVYVGKLFAKDERRRVKDPEYLLRMLGRADRYSSPLLSLGGLYGSEDLILEKIDGKAVAFLPLQNGTVTYEKEILGFLPSLSKALKKPEQKVRPLIQLHQVWNPQTPRMLQENEILLVKTLPLHIRTVFGKVVDELLPAGYQHTSASILEPETQASGDIYELFGSSAKEINDIPLEFYTLEPHREHVFFSDRDQLQICLENPQCLFKALDTAPAPKHHKAAVFIVKSDQLLNLSEKDWIVKEAISHEFPGFHNPTRQGMMAEKYIQQQPSYPFLKAIEDGFITSQGILLCRHMPSPLMKKMFLSNYVHRNLKGIYFQHPSRSHGDFFSHEDRSMLLDLAKFGIPVFWVDQTSGMILQYVPKPDKDTGMFVPLNKIDEFINATSFGIYGSNLLETNFEEELTLLLQGIQSLAKEMTHPLLNPSTPIALITGGGPGVMEVGNRVARKTGVLSCANVADFRAKNQPIVNEQKQNHYIDAKMTYRIDRLVERQAEFNLDFPIFLMGGIGTDFEFCLEEVRRKVGASASTPILLFGSESYWRDKITSRFKSNLANGTIVGSEWVSNCFFCVDSAKKALKIYRYYFEGTLMIGKEAPIAPDGFITVS